MDLVKYLTVTWVQAEQNIGCHQRNVYLIAVFVIAELSRYYHRIMAQPVRINSLSTVGGTRAPTVGLI